MTARKLASLIAKREGKRSQARIGDIREILRILVELHADAMESGDTGENWRNSPGDLICVGADKLIAKRKRKARKAGK